LILWRRNLSLFYHRINFGNMENTVYLRYLNPFYFKTFSLLFICSFIHSFILAVLGFELPTSRLLGRRPTTWATPAALLCWTFFRIGSFQLFATILLVSASWAARITGVSHQHQAELMHFKFHLNYAVWASCNGAGLVGRCQYFLNSRSFLFLSATVLRGMMSSL
jgi:hypothetical protein